MIRVALDANGNIVNRIVVDENTGDLGLTYAPVTEAPITVPVLDDQGNPTGATETITVPLQIGGTYINSVYTPPAEA